MRLHKWRIIAMHCSVFARHVGIALAAAGAMGLVTGETAVAGPTTGMGLPVTTEQPSLGLSYLVRTNASNAAELGQVVLFAGNYAPSGFDFADGQLLAINQNQALFSQLGTTYGGDGFNNFALPNLAGRTVVGTGQGAGLTNRSLGSVAGTTTQTLTTNELPPFAGASGITSGSQPLPTLQPSLALNQRLVTQGFFPSPTTPQAQGAVIGQVLTYAGTALPTGQLQANGQQVPIAQQPALFSLLGNTYGGSFPITFAVPNLAGRAATEAGAAPGLIPQALGTTAGAEDTTLTVANLPPERVTLANGKPSILGGLQPFSVQQPSLAVHYIIAVQGAFPSRSLGIVPTGTSGPITDNTPFLGEISLYAGSVAPAGWEFADGQLLSIAANAALFSVIGTTFGGNGFANFALPDLMDRLAVGTGNGVTIGRMFGSDFDMLDYAQLPAAYPASLPAANKVAEPASVAIMLVGLLGLGYGRRRSGATC
jgi:microcystin-dependent protein